MQILSFVAIVVLEMYSSPQVVKVKPMDGDLTMTSARITLDMQVIDILKHRTQTHDRESVRKSGHIK